MAAMEKPEYGFRSVPTASPAAPTESYSTNHAAVPSPPEDSHLLRVVWPEPPTIDGQSSAATNYRAREVGPYEIIEELARGGIGVIYRARDTRNGQDVALKMLRTGSLARPEELQRFHRESQTQAGLQHPHILPILESGECEGNPYFVMPLISGGSLFQQRNAFVGQTAKVVALVEKIARAVAHAHRHGILHRDLKPGNILLNDLGDPFVSDFGLAKAEGSSILLTRADQVVGTPAYMAPEQAECASVDKVSPRSDVWSLGVLLYELLTGQLPFTDSKPSGIVREILHRTPVAPHQLRPDLDPALERIVLRCLEKKPAGRYATAAELADDLARWCMGEPPLAERAWRRVRRFFVSISPRWWGLVAGVAVLWILGGIWWQVGKQSPPKLLRESPSRMDPTTDFFMPLRQGHAVTLIGARGAARRPVQTDGQVEDILRPSENRFEFYVRGQGQCRVELVPPGYLPERYRVRLELRHDTPSHGIIGIYLLRHVLKLPGNRVADTYLTIPLGKPETVIEKYREIDRPSILWLWGHFDPVENWPDSMVGFSWENSLPIAPHSEDERANARWRTLVVEVCPEGLSVLLDGEHWLQAKQNTLVPGPHEVDDPLPFSRAEAPQVFAPEGGLGLFLISSRMSVRNFVIEPLSP